MLRKPWHFYSYQPVYKVIESDEKVEENNYSENSEKEPLISDCLQEKIDKSGKTFKELMALSKDIFEKNKRESLF